MLCNWTDDDCGLGRVHWVNVPDDGESFHATVGLEDGRNVLRFASVGCDGRAVRDRRGAGGRRVSARIGAGARPTSM